MIKRVTLSFNLDIEEQEEAYKYLNSLGRNKTKGICRLIKNKSNSSNFNYDELVNRLLNDKEFIGKLRGSNTDDGNNEDEELILNGLQGFF